MGRFSDTKVPWNHFGKKQRLYFAADELEQGVDLYQLLMRKVYDQVPDFQGIIAYNDSNGRQINLWSDADVRAALQQQRNKLKVYSAVQPDRGFIAAADMSRGASRSQSVPPPQSRYSSDNRRAPSSLDTNYNYRADLQSPAPPARRPPPPPPFVGSQSPNVYAQGTSYGQPLLYGMPPQNLMLAQFLTHGHYPFTKFSWVGPNKFHNFGPYPYRSFYNRGGYGPSW